MEAISTADFKESCLPQTILKTKVNRHIWPQNSFISDLRAPKSLGKLEGARVMRAPTCMLYAYTYTYHLAQTHTEISFGASFTSETLQLLKIKYRHTAYLVLQHILTELS